MNRRIKRLIASLTPSFFLLLPLHLYFSQEREIFQNTPLPTEYRFSWNIPFKELFIEVEPRVKLNGLLFPSEEKRGIVLYFHGRGKNLSQWGKEAKKFVRRGYDCFIFDYRGFGKSDGKIFSEASLLQDLEKVYSFLLQSYSPEQFVFYGCSLGTGLATYLASKYPPKMLILESPYSSLVQAVNQARPYLPRFLIQWVLKYPLKTKMWMKSVSCPTYIFHSKADQLIPYQECTLLQRIKGPPSISITLLERASHEEVVKEELYQEKLSEILLSLTAAH